MNSSGNSNFTMIPNEIFQINRFKARTIALYCYLKYRSYCGNGVIAYPSQKRIMKELGIGSYHTLRKCLDDLIFYDFLEVKRGSSFNGNSTYYLKKPKEILPKTEEP